MNPFAGQPGVLSPATKPASPKFTHPSGSRPLPGYTIKRGIGWGGFGEVYYATTDAGKECALKLIRRNLDIELRGVTQCLNLKHPNLLSLFDIRRDEHEDTWIIMEFVSGESLEDAIARHPNGMPLADAMHWFDGLTAGVGYLHDHGIVHRDLKPGNIFSDESIVKVGDYGLSKFISCSRRSGQTESVGTVHYMAPEIANGRYGKEIDIYALGVMLYEMLTGHVPFDGESVGEVLMKHLTAEPKLDKLAEPFRTVVARTLAKNPEQRIRTVGEMRELLAAAMPVDRYAPTMVSSLPPSERPSLAGASIPYATPSAQAPSAQPQRAESANSSDSPPVARAATGASGYAADNPFREPLARAVFEGCRRLRYNWEQVNLPPKVKTLIIIAAIVGGISTAPYFVIAALCLLPVYGVYWVIRALVVGPDPIPDRPPHSPPLHGPPPYARQAAGQHAAHPATPIATPATANDDPHANPPTAESLTRRERLHRRRRVAANALPKSFRTKFTEATGAMLLAALFSLAYSVVANLVIGWNGSEAAQYLWMAMVTTLGAWMVIVPARIWEGRRGETVARRSTMLVLGMCLGMFAWLLAAGFALSMPFSNAILPTPNEIGPMKPFNRHLFDAVGNPGVWSHAAYFAFLFLVPPWWRQADGTRRRRLVLWTALMMGAWAYVLSMFWLYPQPWGVVVAIGISLVAQIAAPVDEQTDKPKPSLAETTA
ncbi:MAG: serine/threonine-protein kinase [Pirellulales bacterium]